MEARDCHSTPPDALLNPAEAKPRIPFSAIQISNVNSQLGEQEIKSVLQSRLSPIGNFCMKVEKEQHSRQVQLTFAEAMTAEKAWFQILPSICQALGPGCVAVPLILPSLNFTEAKQEVQPQHHLSQACGNHRLSTVGQADYLTDQTDYEPYVEEQIASRVLCIGNIRSWITEEKLRSTFAPFGIIEDVSYDRHNIPGVMPVAYVRFENSKMARLAKLALDGQKFDDLPCKINYMITSPTCLLWVHSFDVGQTPLSLWPVFSKFGQVKKLLSVPGQQSLYILFTSVNAAVAACNQFKGVPADNESTERRYVEADFVDPSLIDKYANLGVAVTPFDLSKSTKATPICSSGVDIIFPPPAARKDERYFDGYSSRHSNSFHVVDNVEEELDNRAALLPLYKSSLLANPVVCEFAGGYSAKPSACISDRVYEVVKRALGAEEDASDSSNSDGELSDSTGRQRVNRRVRSNSSLSTMSLISNDSEVGSHTLVVKDLNDLANETDLCWEGRLTMKKSSCNGQLYLVSGCRTALQSYLYNARNEAVDLDISHRFRYKEEGGKPEIWANVSGAMFLMFVPCYPMYSDLKPDEVDTSAAKDMVRQLTKREVAGVIKLRPHKQPFPQFAIFPEGMLYMFPYCDFAHQILKKINPNISIFELSHKETMFVVYFPKGI